MWLILFAVGDAVVVLDLVCTPDSFGKPLALGVCVIPEVEEQEKKDHAVDGDDVNEDRVLIGAILHEEVLTNVSGDDHKLRLYTQDEIGFQRIYKRGNTFALNANQPNGLNATPTSCIDVRCFFHHRNF